ncbi:TPA: hypothetical protein ACXIJH_005053 [Serratia marcescens]
MDIRWDHQEFWLFFLINGCTENISQDWYDIISAPVEVEILKANPDLLLNAFGIIEFPEIAWKTLFYFSQLSIEERLSTMEILHNILIYDEFYSIAENENEWGKIKKAIRPQLWFKYSREKTNANLYINILRLRKNKYWSRLRLLFPRYIIERVEASDRIDLSQAISDKVSFIWETIVSKVYDNKIRST